MNEQMDVGKLIMDGEIESDRYTMPHKFGVTLSKSAAFSTGEARSYPGSAATRANFLRTRTHDSAIPARIARRES
eukprot:scaffold270292_cov38-Prasinocladus_malaysianus.AAC.1